MYRFLDVMHEGKKYGEGFFDESEDNGEMVWYLFDCHYSFKVHDEKRKNEQRLKGSCAKEEKRERQRDQRRLRSLRERIRK